VNTTARTRSVQETLAVAARLAKEVRPGDVIALEGDLGAGKTQFVRGLVQGLGGETRAVSSPTFVLMNIYDTPRLQVYHLDAYRVGGEEDLEAIGFSELLEQGGLVVVEWWQRVAGLLPQQKWLVRLTSVSPRVRNIEILPPR
jgi:tRNA threonylcarbamoyladenosine biosynthesis protein TsaE